ncbi:MAG: YbaB/EbfC family nucleoid-associated protein [Rickettsiales bacterium]
MNIQKMLKQAQQMQTQMTQVQEQLAEEEMDGTAGGGMVTVTVNGRGEMRKLNVDKSLVDPEDKEMMEDLIIAAFNDAKTKMDAMASEQMSKVTAGMGLPAGMKLPF